MIATLRRVSYQLSYLIARIDTKNLKTFAVCVVIATGLWLLNLLRKEHKQEVSYPIEFQFNTERYIALKPLPKAIKIKVKGSGWQILQKIFRVRITPITIDLSPQEQMKKPFLLRHELRAEAEKVIQNIKLEEVIPDSLPIPMDYRYKRVLRLTVDSSKIQLPKDYRVVTPIQVYPELIAVIGPKKMLKALPNPYKLDLSDVKIDQKYFRGTFQIDIPSVPSFLLQQDEDKVSIAFEIERFVHKNIITQVNVTNGKTKRLIPITLHYSVRESAANAIKESDFLLEADWTEYKKETGTINIRLKAFPSQLRKEDITFIKQLKVD